MAPRATRGRVNTPLFLKIFSCVSLDGSSILVFDCTRNPREVGDLVHGSKGVLGMAMAIEAESHAKVLGVADFLHLVDPAVAFHTTYTAVNVNGVVEVGVVGNFVNADPWDGSALSEETVPILVLAVAQDAVLVGVFPVIAGPNRFQGGRIRLNGLVAAHADIGCGNPCVSRLVHTMVTIAAVKAEFAYVKAMVIGNRLRGLVANTHELRSAVIVDAGSYAPAH